TVLTYIIKKSKPLITELHDTFVRSPEALQKSALVRLIGTGGELCVRDRVASTRIGQYFQSFLGAHRRFNPSQLTTKLADISKRVAKRHEAELGSSVMRGFTQRVYETIQNQQGFDPSANKEAYLASIYGSLPQDSKVRGAFEKELRKERMESETFDFDRQAVS